MDEYKRSPLHYVCIDHPTEGRVEIAKSLLLTGLDINQKDKDNWTPLHFAAQENCKEVVDFLIKNNADIFAKDVNGNTPLWVAVMHSDQDPEIINSLIRAGSNPDEKNFHGVSPRDIEPELFEKKT